MFEGEHFVHPVFGQLDIGNYTGQSDQRCRIRSSKQTQTADLQHESRNLHLPICATRAIYKDCPDQLFFRGATRYRLENE